jgi:hypothetical protein
MFQGIGQQRVPSEKTKMRWNPADMEWCVVDDAKPRLVQDRPAVRARPAAKVHILIIEKEITI